MGSTTRRRVFTSSGGGASSTTTINSVGAGNSLVVAPDNVKSLIAGTNITIIDNGNDLTITTTSQKFTVVTNYSTLPDPTTVSGKFYWVSNSQGTKWLWGSLGGTYYDSGVYYSNGTTWEYTEIPYNATQAEVNTGTNNDKFVTPSTFTNASKWSTKQDTLTPAALTKTDDTNVTLTLGGTPATSLLQATSLTLGWTGTLADGRIASASTWNAKESVLTFSTGLTRSTNTITNNLSTGVSGGQTIIGSTSTNSGLIIKSTTGVGTTGADIIFQVGNNGATEAIRINNNGRLLINSSSELAGDGALQIKAITGSIGICLTLQSDTTTNATLIDFYTSAGTVTAYVGISGTANNIITGSAKGDLILRAQGTNNILLSANGGTSPAFFIKANTLSIGFGNNTSPSAYIHPAAGTATASTSPFKFTLPGVLLSTREAGAFEADIEKVYYTPTSTARQALSGVLYTQTADKTITNTVTETSIVGTGVGSLSTAMTLPANFLIAGKTIRLRIGGIYSTPITGASIIIKIKFGTTTIATVTTSSLFSNASNLEFDGEILMTCRSTGVSGSVVVHGDIEYATGVSGTIAVDPLNNAGVATTVDTTASKLIDVTITWDSNTTSRTVTSTILTMEVLN